MDFFEGLGSLGEIAEALGVGEIFGEALGGREPQAEDVPPPVYERRLSRRDRPAHPNDM